ncbi:hypothetical protein AWRI1631_131950 [Saccharomyces cerevisiae AWRI1631]|uniref:Uncharacterized protein n=1 Tax=Saccharomyces cerevisiae (strain AWRI1631) TaxID=545124 RepID=B5VPI2_YEAS6|nr:hypothetical protein AWRI1631_131950 [Saccharomyces cerevisiae AWRI1631]
MYLCWYPCSKKLRSSTDWFLVRSFPRAPRSCGVSSSKEKASLNVSVISSGVILNSSTSLSSCSISGFVALPAIPGLTSINFEHSNITCLCSKRSFSLLLRLSKDSSNCLARDSQSVISFTMSLTFSNDSGSMVLMRSAISGWAMSFPSSSICKIYFQVSAACFSTTSFKKPTILSTSSKRLNWLT